MKESIRACAFLVFFAMVSAQCSFFKKSDQSNPEPPYYFDLKDIKKRGSLRVAVDNNSTGYYIYRGRTLGYEYELLSDFAKDVGVLLEIQQEGDIEGVFDKLERGEVDLVAINLEMDSTRIQRAAFTVPLGTLSTVLVGKSGSSRIKSWEDLSGDTIYVRKGAIFKTQLRQIQDSLQVDFAILESDDHEETLIEQVVDGQIKWTVADQNIARANATYYDGLNISWTISKSKEVSWVVRKNAPDLLEVVNEWLRRKEKKDIPILYSKYFLNSKNSYFRTNSAFSSVGGNRISQFDAYFKDGANELGWDWRLLASLVYKESRFDTTAVSYAGARGLLQLMPVTLERFGVENPNDPIQSLSGGVRYLKYLDKFWLGRVPEINERIKFILASYNIGHGHVNDAWRLALKYGANTQVWDEVAVYLILKSDPEYYRDPLVKSGYAKGHLAVNYVEDIMSVYNSYKTLVKP